MGCGQTSCRDDEDRQYRREQLAQVRSIDPAVLLDNLCEIEALIWKLNTEMTRATRHQFNLMDQIIALSKWKKWTKKNY